MPRPARHPLRLARIDPADLAAERALARLEAAAVGADPAAAESAAVAALIGRERAWVEGFELECDLADPLDAWTA